MRHRLSRRRTVLYGHGDGLCVIAVFDHLDDSVCQSHQIGHLLLQQTVQRGHGTSGEHHDVSGGEGLQIDGAERERSHAEHLSHVQSDVPEGKTVVALQTLATQQTREELLQTRDRNAREKNNRDYTHPPPHCSR